MEEHEHSSAGASVQFPNMELHRAFAFRAAQIRGFACGKSVRGGISVTMMVIHAWSLWRLCREGLRIWFSVWVPFKFYWRTPPRSQKRGKTVGRFQAIYHAMFNYVYHVELLSFGGLFKKNVNLGLVSSRGSGCCIHLHLTDFAWTFQSKVQASSSAIVLSQRNNETVSEIPAKRACYISSFSCIFYFLYFISCLSCCGTSLINILSVGGGEKSWWIWSVVSNNQTSNIFIWNKI